jgi:hypothetical protein
MEINFDSKWKPIFDFSLWLEKHKPSKIRKSTYWDDVHLEYYEVVEEFKKFLYCNETILDKNQNQLTPIQIYNAIEEYKIRIQKLMLIFNIRLYKTYNVNKKTNVRYIVMRAFWIDHYGKPVKYFSRNIGAENKVLSNGNIPKHMLDSVQEDILHLMWDQYTLDLDDNYMTIFYDDGNTFIVND